MGNRTSSLGVSPYSYNSSNELTSIPGATYTYDNNGNLLTKVAGSSTTSFAWDFENRLTSVTLPGTGGTVTFKYDPFGRRIEKVYTHSGATTTSIYAYDGDNQVEEVAANGNPVARYVQGLGIDEPLAILRSGVTSYYHADGLGSVNALSQINGSYDEIYKYDSFGVRLSYDGTVTNPFQYTAREFDSETSLLYYRARYYDPSVGRFISEDPVEFNGGTNFYGYVSNHPTDLIDPRGLLQVCCRSAHLPIVRAAAWLTRQEPPCHCFLKLSDGRTLGGYFDWSLLNFGALTRRENDTTDHDKYASEAKCSDVPGNSCANDKKAKKAFDSLPRVLGDYGTGPGDVGTSNRVVVSILSGAGIYWTLPSCAWAQQAVKSITYSNYPIIGIP